MKKLYCFAMNCKAAYQKRMPMRISFVPASSPAFFALFFLSSKAVSASCRSFDSRSRFPFRKFCDSKVLRPDGSVRNEDLEEAEVVMLTACFRYEEQEFEEMFPVRILPAVLTEKEQLLKRIENALEEQDRESRTESSLALPDRIGSQKIIWKEVIQDSSGYFFLLMCAAAVFIFLAGTLCSSWQSSTISS